MLRDETSYQDEVSYGPHRLFRIPRLYVYSHLIGSSVSDISRSESKDTLDQVLVVLLVVIVLFVIVTLGLVLHLLLSIVLPLVGRSSDGESGQSQEEDGRETHYVCLIMKWV